MRVEENKRSISYELMGCGINIRRNKRQDSIFIVFAITLILNSYIYWVYPFSSGVKNQYICINDIYEENKIGMMSLSSSSSLESSLESSSPLYESIQIKEPFGVAHADDYDVMKELGVKMNRKDIAWNLIEPEDDVWNWAVWDMRCDQLYNNNMTALPILDYGNLNVQNGTDHGNRIFTEHDINEWLEYVNESINRYYINHPLHISQWEIWNEPNLGEFNASEGFWTGTDEEFFELQKRTASFIKEHYPNVTVVSGGITGYDPEYLDAMFKYGAMEDVDVVAFHPYSGSGYDTLADKINEVKEVCFRNNFTGSLWITEVGFDTRFEADPTNSGESSIFEAYKRRLELQGSLVPKVYAIALASNISKIVWFCLNDYYNYTYREHNFGLMFYDSNEYKPEPYRNDILKPAGYAYKVIANNLNHSKYLPNGVRIKSNLPSSTGLRVYYFLKSSGDIVLIFWNSFNTKIRLNINIPSVIEGLEAYFPPSYKLRLVENSSNYLRIDEVGTSNSEVTQISTEVDFYPNILIIDLADGTEPLFIDIFTYLNSVDIVLIIIFPVLGIAVVSLYILNYIKLKKEKW
ncbi:MAG: GH39 family glycosyl hydrolase [Promethearchaeota archaeon]